MANPTPAHQAKAADLVYKIQDSFDQGMSDPWKLTESSFVATLLAGALADIEASGVQKYESALDRFRLRWVDHPESLRSWVHGSSLDPGSPFCIGCLFEVNLHTPDFGHTILADLPWYRCQTCQGVWK